LFGRAFKPSKHALQTEQNQRGEVSFPRGKEHMKATLFKRPPRFPQLAGCTVAMVGMAVLVGWMLDITALKSLLPGWMTTKANTAICMLLCGGALALLPRKAITKPIRLSIAMMAVGVIALGTATLSEYFFGLELGIDQALFGEVVDPLGTSHPGRMSPASAFCLLLAGCSLLSALLPPAMRLRLSIFAALNVALIVVAGLALLDNLTATLFNLRSWNDAGMAVYTAAAFILLGCGLLALTRGEGGLTWSLDPLTTGGFAIGIAALLAATGVSYHFTHQLQQSAAWVSHTQEVLKEIEGVSASVAALGSGERDYFDTGDEHVLESHKEITDALRGHLGKLRTLTADNPHQQPRLDQLEPLIAQSIRWGEQTIAVRRQQKLSAAERLMVAGKARALLDGIGRMIREIESEEYSLLDQRQRKALAVAATTFLMLPMGVFLSLTMLSLGLFLLNAGVVERKLAQTVSTRLAAIVESSDDAIISKTLDGTITSWNRGAEKLFGYPAQECIGKSMLMLFPPERLREEPEILARIRRGEGVDHFETVRVTKGGQRIDVSVTLSPMRNHRGEIIGASNIARDISARKQTEESLRETQARLSSTLAAGSIGTWTWDIPNNRLIADKFTAGFFGIEADAAATGLPVEAYLQGVLKEDQPGVADALARAIKSCGHYDVEYRVRQTSGELFWLQARGRVDCDGAGNAVRFHGAVMDVTERKRTEARVRRLVDSNVQGVIFWNARGDITEANNAFLRIVGYSREDLEAGRIDWAAMTPPEYASLDRHSLDEIKATGVCTPYEKEYIRKDGSRVPILLGAATFADNTDEGVCFLLDITERKAAEKTIRQLNVELDDRVAVRTAELEAANKELEAFSYSVSHDLRAPLRAVNGFAGIVLEEFGPQLPEAGRDYLMRIRNGGQRMGVLIDDLLAFARLRRKSVGRQMVDTAKLVNNVLDELAPQRNGRRIEINVGTLPASDGDPALLKQVWVNLISNALKYTRGREPAVIEIGSTRENGDDVFSVRDNGAGFDMQFSDKLFGVFQRLHRAEEFEGTGVGLAIVQRIVHRHSGRVWAEAETNRGATFYFTLGGHASA
jgi:PAS domain S-box-containing protein